MSDADLSTTIAPKSDQMNSDDLISGPRTIKVTKVRLLGEADQPVAIFYEGDNGKPFKPCKSMRRVLVQVWGGDGSQYAGRAMTLFRDPEVAFGGAKVGGIRISHMSGIDKDVTMALTATRAQRKPFTVKPLKVEAKVVEKASAPKPAVTAQDDFNPEAFTLLVEETVSAADNGDALKAWWESAEIVRDRKAVAVLDQELSGRLRSLVAGKIGELAAGGEV